MRSKLRTGWRRRESKSGLATAESVFWANLTATPNRQALGKPAAFHRPARRIARIKMAGRLRKNAIGWSVLAYGDAWASHSRATRRGQCASSGAWRPSSRGADDDPRGLLVLGHGGRPPPCGPARHDGVRPRPGRMRVVLREPRTRAGPAQKAAAILQGFPDGWRFEGKTKASRWSQIGQAMPPPLAEAVARSIAVAMSTAIRDAAQ